MNYDVNAHRRHSSIVLMNKKYTNLEQSGLIIPWTAIQLPGPILVGKSSTNAAFSSCCEKIHSVNASTPTSIIFIFHYVLLLYSVLNKCQIHFRWSTRKECRYESHLGWTEEVNTLTMIYYCKRIKWHTHKVISTVIPFE